MQVPNSKNTVIARLTALRADGSKLIIEIHAGADFSNFYHYYTQTGNKRSSKKHIRTANRNEGLTPWHRAYRMEPGLESIAERLKNTPPQFRVSDLKIRVMKKRAYKKLLAAAPADLGGFAPVTSRPFFKFQPGISISIPRGYTSIKKRMDILMGKA